MKYRLKSSGSNVALFIFIVVILSHFFPSPNLAKAAQAQKEEKFHIYELGEIVVAGERDKKESPTTISEVSGEEIGKHNARNLGEALRLLPEKNTTV